MLHTGSIITIFDCYCVFLLCPLTDPTSASIFSFYPTAGDSAGVAGDNVDNAYVSVSRPSTADTTTLYLHDLIFLIWSLCMHNPNLTVSAYWPKNDI